MIGIECEICHSNISFNYRQNRYICSATDHEFTKRCVSGYAMTTFSSILPGVMISKKSFCAGYNTYYHIYSIRLPFNCNEMSNSIESLNNLIFILNKLILLK